MEESIWRRREQGANYTCVNIIMPNISTSIRHILFTQIVLEINSLIASF